MQTEQELLQALHQNIDSAVVITSTVVLRARCESCTTSSRPVETMAGGRRRSWPGSHGWARYGMPQSYMAPSRGYC